MHSLFVFLFFKPLYGAVKSVEDHGYILTFGADDVFTGFLAAKDAKPKKSKEEEEEEEEPETRPLVVGQPVWSMVKEVRGKFFPQPIKKGYILTTP